MNVLSVSCERRPVILLRMGIPLVGDSLSLVPDWRNFVALERFYAPYSLSQWPLWSALGAWFFAVIATVEMFFLLNFSFLRGLTLVIFGVFTRFFGFFRNTSIFRPIGSHWFPLLCVILMRLSRILTRMFIPVLALDLANPLSPYHITRCTISSFFF